MNQLYTLTFHHLVKDYSQDFFIGVFSSFQNAQSTAKKFLKEVEGFKDYPCEYEIIPKNIIGQFSQIESVYMIWGWNVSEDLDEMDIWESDLYTDYHEAQKELRIIQDKYLREEWNISQYVIDKSYCHEGFVQIYY